ncbi:MAG TPA: MarP family serine protease [Solirubrobacteraceae bacterium]|jgi:S1-C subfamily serine protease|nr:MarP family serine protease [Solirubrobacteraceae bacterium]
MSDRTWQVTQLDWIIVAFAAILAGFGFRRGFIVGALSFGGFALGAFLGTRLGPLLLPRGSSSPYAPAFGLFGALLAGGILASGLEGLGFKLRRALFLPGLGLLDGLLGAALSAALGLGIVWILAAVAAQAPGQNQLRADIQRSAVLRELNKLLPPTGSILNALARLDPLPEVTGPSPDVAAPAPRIAHEPGVRAASHSVVRVLGSACGLAIEGSGWVARPGIVVTNAHVVAGEQDTTVELGGHSPGLPARPIAFDPRNDIAVLRVPDIGVPALSLVSEPASGTGGAILGYPENGPFNVQPGRIGRTQTVLTQDAYGSGPVSRLLTPLRGLVRPGNSGGPLVDGAGHVLTTVFAGTVGGGQHGGYGVANATVAHALATADAAGPGVQVSTGPCTAG